MSNLQVWLAIMHISYDVIVSALIRLHNYICYCTKILVTQHRE